jgi:phosphate transport system permease protein
MSRSLLNDSERKRNQAKRNRGRAFVAITFVPVVLALTLIATLFLDVISDTVSWQVTEPAQTTESWSFAEGFAWFNTWENVVEKELVARGEDPAVTLNDPEERRKFRLRNRVELLWSLNGEPMRYVVTNSRDDIIKDYGFFEGLRERDTILANLKAGEEYRLNPWLDAAFITKNASRTPLMAGLGNALIGTLWVIGLVILVSLPIGLGAAIYLEEYAPDNRLTRFIELNIRNLAGVPSIVYGILGLYAFVRIFGFGPTVLSASLTLALLILPVVIIASREAIKAVPPSLREASYGLGASKWQTVSRVVMPNAVAGITTGMILASARAIGETAPLLMVGAAAFIPRPPSGPLSTYTVVPIQIYSWVSENDAAFANVASAGILVLLAVLLVLYGAAFYLRRRFERSW